MLVHESANKVSYDISKYKNRTGFNAGITLEFPIEDLFSIDLGIILSTNGYTFFTSDSRASLLGYIDEYTWSRNFIYLDFPVRAKAYIKAGRAKIYGALGPYFAAGAGGKGVSKINYYGRTTSDSDHTFDSNLRRIDFGVSSGAGVIIHSFQINIAYGFGLIDISPETDFAIRNRVLGISAGYRFGN